MSSVLEMSSRHSMIRRGQKSAVAAVCYITASQGTDERTGQSFDYGAKGHVTDVQVMLPEGMPSWMSDPVKLMAAAELYEDVWAERRYKTPLYQERHKASAMVAHTAHYSLHNALRDDPEAMWSVIHDFVKARYTVYGVGVVVAVHDEAHNLHFHVQSTKRVLEPSLEGFGRKAVCFQSPAVLSVWAKENRATLAKLQNEALGRLGVDQVVEHRSFVDREIDLEAALHRGELGEALIARGDTPHVFLENQAIERRNLSKILDNPGLILDVLGASRATFTEKNMLYEITRRMQGDEGLIQEVWEKVQGHPDLVRLPCVGDEEQRYTTKTYQHHENRMFEVATQMHGEEIPLNPWSDVKIDGLNEGQEEAAWALASRSRLVLLRGAAGVGKTTLLRPVARSFEDQGYRVRGLALAGVAVEGLRDSLGCEARTIASFLKREALKQQGKLQASSMDLLSRDVVIIDEAGMVDVPTLSRVLSIIERSGAMVRLVGDPEQLKAIGAGDGFRGLWERLGGVSLSSVVRQKSSLDQEAVSLMSRGFMDQGLGLFRDRTLWFETHEILLETMVSSFIEDKIQKGAGGLMLAFLRRDVKVLNDKARTLMRAKGLIHSERSFWSPQSSEKPQDHRSLGIGDTLVFLEKNKEMGVVNGTRGRVMGFDEKGLVHIKTEQGRDVIGHPDTFKAWDYAYAMTVHKSQGVTVRQAWMKADRMLGSEGHYVGLSRHQDKVTLMVDRTVFKDAQDLVQALTRGGQKDLIQDYGRDFAEETLARYQDLKSERWDRSVSEERRIQAFREFKELSGELVQHWDQVASKARRQGLTLSTLERYAGFRVRPSSSLEKAVEERTYQYQERASQARGLWQDIRRTHPGRLARLHPDYGRFSEVRAQRDALAFDITHHPEEHRPFIALHRISHKALSSQAQAHTQWQEEHRLQDQEEQQRLDAQKLERGAKTDQAQHLLTQSLVISGTVAETYLREHRGIRSTLLPDDVRFLPQGVSLPSGHMTRHPALMAVGRDASGEISCVQLISLDEVTGQKARIETPKRTYGALSGAFVCLQKGEASQPVVITEGVETALSLKEAGLQGTLYSTLGIHNLKHVKDFVLHDKAQMILAADQDGEHAPSHKIVDEVAASLQEKGHHVLIARPPSTADQVKRDWNDVLKQEGVQALRQAFESSLEKVQDRSYLHNQEKTQEKIQENTHDKPGTHEDASYEQGIETQHTRKGEHSSGKGLRGRYDLHELHARLKLHAADLGSRIITCPLDPKESSRTHKVFKDKTQKISLCVEGSKAGLWYDFKRCIGGNILDLIQDQRHISKGEAIVHAAGLVGLESERVLKPHIQRQDHERPKPEHDIKSLSSSLSAQASQDYKALIPPYASTERAQKQVMTFEDKRFISLVLDDHDRQNVRMFESLAQSRVESRLYRDAMKNHASPLPTGYEIKASSEIKDLQNQTKNLQNTLIKEGMAEDLAKNVAPHLLAHQQRHGTSPTAPQKAWIIQMVDRLHGLKKDIHMPELFKNLREEVLHYIADRVIREGQGRSLLRTETLKETLNVRVLGLQKGFKRMHQERSSQQQRSQDRDLGR